MVGVGANAGDDLGVAGLHGTRGAAQGHHARGAAGGDVVQPARAQAQVLGDAHGGVRRHRETADGQAIDLLLGDAAGLHQGLQRPADEPVRAVG